MTEIPIEVAHELRAARALAILLDDYIRVRDAGLFPAEIDAAWQRVTQGLDVWRSLRAA